MSLSQPKSSYRRVAAVLRDRILDGTWAPGHQLPTEQVLCGEFKVSRITVRQALQILNEEQLIYSRQGSGSYVSDRPIRRIPLLQAGFSQSIDQHAPELVRHVVLFEHRSADAQLAAQLEITLGSPVLYVRRVDSLEGEPVAFDDVYIPQVFSDQLKRRDLKHVHFVQQWKKIQALRITHIHQHIEAVNATLEHKKLLGVKPRTAMLKTTETIMDQSGKPAGIFVTYYHGEKFSLNSTSQAAT